MCGVDYFIAVAVIFCNIMQLMLVNGAVNNYFSSEIFYFFLLLSLF